MAVRTRTTPRFRTARTLQLTLLAAAMTACSASPLPIGPTPAADEIAPGDVSALVALAEEAAREGPSEAVSVPSRSGIIISNRATVAGAKRGLPQAIEKDIGPAGGRMALLARDRRTLVHFLVPRRALDETETIRMEVVGSGPSIEVHFGPSGLQFLRDCRLTISIPESDLDLDELGGFLLNEDGTVTEVPYRIRSFLGRVYITISISHFSIYSPSDGEDAAHDEEGGYGYGYGYH